MITPEQRERRRAYIGSSDSPAILGLSPWATAADVYWSKVAPSEDVTSAAMSVGNVLEPSLVAWCGEQLGEYVMHDVECVPRGVMAANLDGKVTNRAEGIEAKYSSRADGWGESGTDEVPDHVLIQCQHQMCVADLERVWVPAAIVSGGRLALRLYCVPRDEEIVQAIVKACERFWRDHVEPQTPPDHCAPALDVLQRLGRSAESVPLGVEVAAAWAELEELKAERKKIEKAEDEAKGRILLALGTAEAGELPDGTVITYKAQRGAPSIDRQALKNNHPDIWQQVAQERTHRVLRIRKGGK